MIFNLPQLVEKVASASPDREAFRCLDKSITYGELHLKTDRLAFYLKNQGIRKGDRVGIFMNRCLETSIAVYGVLKSGAAYVPLDPFAPLGGTVSIMNDCSIAFLLTTDSQERKIVQLAKEATPLKIIIGITCKLPVTTVSWDSIFEYFLEKYEPSRILEQDLAFILYTSGSTGIPKGIMHTHYSALSLAKIAASTYDFDSSDIFGNPAPLHFDPSTFGYFVAPLVGAVTVIIPEAHLKMPASLSALIAKEKITVWFSVPLVLIQLLFSGTLQKHDFSALKWVLFAGEVFITKHLRVLMQLWPHARFSNLYGPAELILCTFYTLKSVPIDDDPIPIGNVWGNTEYKILDGKGIEVAVGSPGELVVRTATLMNGYWNDKNLTAQSFYTITIANGYDHIYYRTGDLVQKNKMGELLFLGRNDRQIKLRGYRLELDGIELTLLKHAAVKEVGVVVLGKDREAQELAAAVKTVSGSKIDAGELREFCKASLPSYAVPDKIKIIADFPRTSSDKINRKEIALLFEDKKR